MYLKINDWEFDIDLTATREHSSFAAGDHCTCGYCENYYRAVKLYYPELIPFLKQFGLHIDGPVEMYPIEPTLYLSGYRVTGKILKIGSEPMMAGSVPVIAEPREPGLFLLEAGEIPLPWMLQEDMDEVIIPANEPEFLEKMYRKLAQRSLASGGMLS